MLVIKVIDSIILDIMKKPQIYNKIDTSKLKTKSNSIISNISNCVTNISANSIKRYKRLNSVNK